MATPIDLRSDTVTRPTPEMRAAMAAAPVGDDQYGEDPSVNRLQDQVASMLGKEAALWLPSGTMANQVALRVLTRPGDDVIVSRESHAVWHETGGSAANAGVQLTEIGAAGVFSVDEFVSAVKPRMHGIYPPTTLVEIENTHNRAGGVIFPQDEAERICAAARERGIATFLDGARLWNAAAALHALEHHVAGLPEDHANARLLAERLASSPNVMLDLGTVQTNIVVFGLGPGAPDAATLVAAARTEGVWVNALGPRSIRALTHRDVTRAQCAQAAEVLRRAVDVRG